MTNQVVKAAQEAVQKSEEFDIRYSSGFLLLSCYYPDTIMLNDGYLQFLFFYSYQFCMISESVHLAGQAGVSERTFNFLKQPKQQIKKRAD